MQLLKQPLRLTNIVINHLNGKVMVKHIVLFKLKDEAPADEKLAAMNSSRQLSKRFRLKYPLSARLKSD